VLELDELLDDDPPPLPPPPDELLLDDELELPVELELLLDELDDEPDDDDPLDELLLDEPELDELVDEELVELVELLDDGAPLPDVPELELPAPGAGWTIGVETLVGSVMPVQATANAAGALTSSSRKLRRSVSCCVSSVMAVLLL
jgi:hypothetical protein